MIYVPLGKRVYWDEYRELREAGWNGRLPGLALLGPLAFEAGPRIRRKHYILSYKMKTPRRTAVSNASCYICQMLILF